MIQSSALWDIGDTPPADDQTTEIKEAIYNII